MGQAWKIKRHVLCHDASRRKKGGDCRRRWRVDAEEKLLEEDYADR